MRLDTKSAMNGNHPPYVERPKWQIRPNESVWAYGKRLFQHRLFAEPGILRLFLSALIWRVRYRTEFAPWVVRVAVSFPFILYGLTHTQEGLGWAIIRIALLVLGYLMLARFIR